MSTSAAAADWSISLPADVSNSDLFGGDLFGDELIDMYGSSAVSDDTTDQDLLNENDKPAANNQVSSNENKSDVAALDGLGAFRPCTSFNDFAELLPPSTTPVTGTAPGQIPVSPATVSMSDSSTTLDHQGSQPMLSYVAGSSTTNTTNAPQVNQPVAKKGVKTNMTLAGKNHAAVIPSSLLPTGTGVKINQQAATQAAAVAAAVSKGQTPDPLEASRHRTNVSQNTRVAPSAPVISTVNRVVPRQTPDHVLSNNRTQSNNIVQAANAHTQSPVAAQQSTTQVNNAISQATITAAAAAAVANAPTAADFTAVAQAAVSNLIMNAGSHTATTVNVPPPEEENVNTIVTSGSHADVSTAHVTALTSSNWVSAVNNNNNNVNTAPTLARTNSVTTTSTHSLIDHQQGDTLAPAAKRRRQNLTPDERAKQNRDRNREHARNTRLRKKAYVEELKRTLTELVTQRDTNEMEQRRVAQRELEQREVRFRVAEEFMKLRGDNQRNTARWTAILEGKFTFTLPVTKYRNMVLSSSTSNGLNTPEMNQPGSIPRQVSIDGVTEDAHRSDQVLRGVDEARADAEHLASFLQSTYFPDVTSQANTRHIGIVFDCNRKNFFMDGTSAFLNWTATTHFFSESNLPPLTFKGVLRATFSPASNKLLSAELSFDTGIITSHVDRIQNLMSVHQGAAAEADAILDSLEMPYFLPTNITTSDQTSGISVPASITSSEKSDSENEEDGTIVMTEMTN